MVKEKHALISPKAFPGIFRYFRKHSQGILYSNPKNTLQNFARGIPRDFPRYFPKNYPNYSSWLFLVAFHILPFLVFKENI